MKKILAIIGIVILILAGGLAVSYNGLAGSRESVETAQDVISELTKILNFVIMTKINSVRE